ncbi:MAG: ABC transporter transmembrane domain-containing protein, partial [Clostridia bacterium]|nr:ABC transporter transmembrane domain-containing protein [Clostridia bacterium]
LTLLTLLMVAVMLFVTKNIAGKSGKYFLAQQNDLGKENGYIEEMMKGQKVVKVFNHEQKSIDEFRELNEQLFYSSYNANKFANILMPINAQL